MIKIRVVCVGKTKEPYIVEGLRMLKRKIEFYCRFDTVFVKEARYASGNIAQWLACEAKGICKHLSGRSVTVACDERGRQMSSIQLANSIAKWMSQGGSHIDFVVGGAYGMADTVKERANFVLSLSSMTMTHQMFRLFLYEQVYRSFTILNGEKYHHVGLSSPVRSECAKGAPHFKAGMPI